MHRSPTTPAVPQSIAERPLGGRSTARRRPRAVPHAAGARPRPLRGLVARPRLLRLLCETTAPLVTARAPAGYGKTALLQQWAQEDKRPFAWIERGGPSDDAAGLMGAIAEQLDEGRGARVLVLDDPQLLDDAGGLALLADAAGRQPPGSLIAIATRAEAALPLGLLRVQGGLLELGADELAMTDDEAAELLREAGVATGLAVLSTLRERTEGWPAGLRLAALALAGRDDVERAVAEFGGRDRCVADYLRDALLTTLADDDVDFLRRCALLGELSGPLCDAALQRRGSGERLRSLARAGLPLTALDRGEERFRLHPLLADMLVADVHRSEPELEPALHRRAGAWHTRAHDAPRALEHALAGGDAERAGELLWDLTPAYAAAGRGRELGDWLARCDEQRLASDPALALSAAAERLTAGDRDAAERWTDAAARGLDEASASDPAAPAQRAALAVLRAGLGRGGARQLLADAADARALAVTGPAHAVGAMLEGAALRLLGETVAARERLGLATRRGAEALPIVRCLALALLALTELEAGDRAEAVALAETAAGELDAADLTDEPACALAYAAAACARADVGEIEQAQVDAEHAIRLLAGLSDPVPWYAAETRVALARALLRLSDAAAARTQLEHAGRLLRVLGDATGLRARLDETWASADSFAIGAVAGPAALTIAELRVLRFLPSHLSFREIGVRLHVSANTVKTQAHAVYRKLDASSRSEAVARASQIGLVDG